MQKNLFLRKSSVVFSFFALLPHILCCALPTLVAFAALGNTLAITPLAPMLPAYQFIEQHHITLLLIATCGVALSGFLNWVAYRIDCRQAACTHGSCAPKKLHAFRIFIISCCLLVADLAWYIFEEHIFTAGF